MPHRRRSETSREPDCRATPTIGATRSACPTGPAAASSTSRSTGLEHIDAALADGGKLVFAGPHGGNYDHGAAFIAQKYGSLTTVAERLKPERLFRTVRGLPPRTGHGSPGHSGRETSSPHWSIGPRPGSIIGLVGDRDLSRHGVPVTFFGEPTSMPAGPALVARRTGATLLAVNFIYRDGQPAATVFDPLTVPTTGTEEHDVATMTQALAARFEIGISEHPE
ncbi:MAG: hypothetical protein V9E98_12095 [Candidatus Nanopelagicales bacterium]